MYEVQREKRSGEEKSKVDQRKRTYPSPMARAHNPDPPTSFISSSTRYHLYFCLSFFVWVGRVWALNWVPPLRTYTPIQSTVSGAGNWRAGRRVFVPDFEGWRYQVSQVRFSNLGMRGVGIDCARLVGCSLGSMTLDDDELGGLFA
jgi:hypothetical protein